MRYEEETVKADDMPDMNLEGNQFTKQRKCDRREFVDTDDDSKWKPFWQRGHSTVDEIRDKKEAEAKRKRDILRATRKSKMYHSNLDLRAAGKSRKKVKISKSVSMHGLNRIHAYESAKNENRNSRMSSMNLPKIDPDIEILGESSSRDSSATNGHVHSGHGRNYHSARRFDGDEDEVSEEDDVYLSDDDPHVSRQNLDKAGEYIVEHDWILKENLAKEVRRVNVKHKKIQIVLPDEDPLETIKTRMDEITMMVKPKAEYGHFIDTIDPAQKAKILKYKDIHYQDIQSKKRKNWTALHRFRDAVSKVLILVRACSTRRKYLTDDKPDTSPDGVKKIKLKNPLEREGLRKSSLGFEVQLALSSHSYYRSADDVKKVMWMLRATKAFKHLFPAQLEENLATVVAYERYDNRRIIAQQGRDPERFYYVLTGKLSKVREYRLLSGVITREEGFVEKGTTTDPQEMSQNWPREHHLVTKGNVEVLILEKSDYLELLHTGKGPPIDFLQGLDLFKEFPCEEFRHNPDAIDFRYYGQDKMIVKDTNRTPWLHVVKTGLVKVIRVQTVIDVQNEDKFAGQQTDELGCVRPFSHASAMLGLLANQRKMKTMIGAISFPEVRPPTPPMFERSNSEYTIPQKLRIWSKDAVFDNPITRRPAYRPLHTAPPSGQSSQMTTPSPRVPVVKKKSKGNKSTNFAVDGITEGAVANRLANITEDSEHSANSNKRVVVTPQLIVTSPNLKSPSSTNGTTTNGTISDRSCFFPPINGESKKENDGFVPHGTYLTREKTEFDQVYNKKAKKEVVHRKTHLQLDVLKPGDIFGLGSVAALFRSMYPLSDRYGGLEHLEPQALASEGPGVTLISDGAEIIKISKRFFLQHAQNNTMLKVETMQREYMTTDEAKTIMYDKETWRQYKSVLLQRTVNNLNRNHTEKVP